MTKQKQLSNLTARVKMYADSENVSFIIKEKDGKYITTIFDRDSSMEMTNEFDNIDGVIEHLETVLYLSGTDF